jgi:hypothetical protein
MAKYTLRINQGATFKLSFYWRQPLRDLYTNEYITDDEGNVIPATPMDLSGYEGRMQLRKSVTAADTLLTLTSNPVAGITVYGGTVSLKDYVKAASIANLTLSGAQTVDGVALVAADRVLVKDQTDPADNGIYVVATGSWSRASDANAFGELNAASVFVYQGTRNARSQWKQTATLTSLTDPQTWEKDTTTGRVDITITDEQTAALTTSGVYDLELESGGGEVHRVLEGKYRLSAEVTR